MESNPSRRELLGFLASLIGVPALSACASIDLPQAPLRGSLIDIHCHVFNASDLPVTRFIRYAFLHDYPEQSEPRFRQVEDPDFIDGLLQLLEAIVIGHAPTAEEEIAVLDGIAAAEAAAATDQAAGEHAIARTAEFLRDEDRAQPSLRRAISGRAKVKAEILRAAGQDERALRAGPLNANEAQDAARRAYSSFEDIGVYLRWFALFRRYRYSLVDQLAARHQQVGFRPLLITPAMIDFSSWVQEKTDSSLRSQMEVMGRIARRRSGPPVHGYMAYDPLREVYFRHRSREPESPLSLVREALTAHGFIGVKLYPPMGFKPYGNAKQTYPKEVVDRVGPTISTDLNRALADLYDLCVELDAPVLAHAAETNGIEKEYARRADPAYWLEVFRRWPSLRVCLAHFGRFSYISAARPAGSQLPESSWEWTIGRFLKSRPDAPVFADMSYYSEIINAEPTIRAFYAGRLKQFVREFDPDVLHLMFGTDWVMLGRVRTSETYTQQVVQFLEQDCGFDSGRVERILSGNAGRFLGLRDTDGTRRRLLAFYNSNGISAGRLPRFETISS